MAGPIDSVRSDKIEGLKNLGPRHTWSERPASLYLDAIEFNGTKGGIICYYNPPVHSVGNPGLDAYLEAIRIVSEDRKTLRFLIFYGGSDPVHAGGDLKESLSKLDKTIETRKEMEVKGTEAEDIDALYRWGDMRLEKGFALYRAVRSLSEDVRLISLCGGGTRFGGSAEIALMCDYLVGDSRSGMCFSEAMIGLIPGWSGVGRTLTKAGLLNAKFMAMTSTEVKAYQLKEIGIYNLVVEIPIPFPKLERTDDKEGDRARYREALQKHNDEADLLLLPKALELAVCPEEDIPILEEADRKNPATEEEIAEQVARRKDPETYRGLWGKPLAEVREQISTLGRPLAPQSIEALEGLFSGYDPSRFDEKEFVRAEMEADARLYRDPRFRAGIIATLEGRVANFKED
ncbi:MAG: enoyl-CoA hydratase/isomerase family protein [Thermodesulfobacteriota bacterium]